MTNCRGHHSQVESLKEVVVAGRFVLLMAAYRAITNFCRRLASSLSNTAK